MKCQHEHKKTRLHSACHEGSHDGHVAMVQDFKKRFWISIFLTVITLILSPMIQEALGLTTTLSFSGSLYILFIVSTGIFFYGGWPFLKGLYRELSVKNPGMMTLIAVAICVAYFYSSAIVFGLKGKMFFWELATLIDIMLLGHWIEMKSVMGAGKALQQLASLMPDTAHLVLENEDVKNISVQELKSGDVLLVKPGEKIPADALVIKGESSVNESMLTGESNPVEKREQMMVIGGSLNGEGALYVKVQKTGKDSFLSGVIQLVKEAQESRSRTQDVANRAAFWLTIVALLGGTLTFFAWILLSTKGLAFALERTVTVMVITCPHALGLAVPLVVAVSTAIAARNGLLIRNRMAFEEARNTQAIIFDKTGTLTLGEFGVVETFVLDEKYEKDEILKYAASLEQHSEHPIAKGIVRSVKQHWPVDHFQAISGKGASGVVKGKQVKVVSPGYLQEHHLSNPLQGRDKLAKEGKTIVYVVIDDQLIGAIALSDMVRPESIQAISKLKNMGIYCLMLTGDQKEVAEYVGKEIGLDEVISEVLPEQKAKKIKEVQSRGFVTAMIGDGVNDAPALAQADIGIAIGAGTDVAVETADIILVKNNLMDVVAVIDLARATYRKMIQNLIWATGYNAFAIPVAAGVFYSLGVVLSPAVGAVFMSLSTVICAVNAKFLRLH